MKFQQCPWCQSFLTEEDESPYGICQNCNEQLGQVPHFDLKKYPKEFLDELPYGNIILDQEDVVLRYNATEASYTGYDPTKIIGRNFFQDIAPCTDVEEFRGKLIEMRQSKSNMQYVFRFTFNNPNFKILVSVLMTSYSNGYTVLSIRKLQELD